MFMIAEKEIMKFKQNIRLTPNFLKIQIKLPRASTAPLNTNLANPLIILEIHEKICYNNATIIIRRNYEKETHDRNTRPC